MSTAVETAIEIRPFHVEVPQGEIDDLRRRLKATRWPEKETIRRTDLQQQHLRIPWSELVQARVDVEPRRAHPIEVVDVTPQITTGVSQ